MAFFIYKPPQSLDRKNCENRNCSQLLHPHIFYFLPLSLFPNQIPSIATLTKPLLLPPKPSHLQFYLAVFTVQTLWRSWVFWSLMSSWKKWAPVVIKIFRIYGQRAGKWLRMKVSLPSSSILNGQTFSSSAVVATNHVKLQHFGHRLRLSDAVPAASSFWWTAARPGKWSFSSTWQWSFPLQDSYLSMISSVPILNTLSLVGTFWPATTTSRPPTVREGGWFLIHGESRTQQPLQV